MRVGWFDTADRAFAAVIALGRWLVLPVSLLLFMQWPLRELVHAYSTQANDLAQWLFALYVSLAMTYATREGSHLAADSVAYHYSAAMRRWIGKTAALLCVVPWSLFVLIAGAPIVWRSITQFEAFPETYSSGYFIIKASAWLLALLALFQGLLEISCPASRR
jgi:TRAP-type mannitol/chloroaromatic compound transport system permease small subunit